MPRGHQSTDSGITVDISLIWAMADNRVIGCDNSLPWKLPDEMKHFMQTTLGKPVIMGRKTFLSMPGALPKRTNIVLTRDPMSEAAGAQTVGDLDQALVVARAQAAADGQHEIMIIGGAEIYAMALPLATRLYITRVHDEPAGDVRFPEFDMSAWHCLSSVRHDADERHSSAFTIELFERR